MTLKAYKYKISPTPEDLISTIPQPYIRSHIAIALLKDWILVN